MRPVWQFSIAQEVVFGPGACKKIGKIARRLKASKALVVTDQVLVQLGVAERIQKPLFEEGISIKVFDGGKEDPPIRVAEECVAFAQGENFDLVVGRGGGSNIDLAKAAAVVLRYGGSFHDYFGEFKVPGPVLPHIAVPTTSGTGSEVSPVSVLTDEEKKIKIGISDNLLRPRVALVDPELCLTMPPKVTADTGMDALCHAIECYTNIPHPYLPVPEEAEIVFSGKEPLADCLAERAIELIGANLRLAVDQGANLEARTQMALGSLLAGMAFSNAGVAAIHALSFPIGGLTKATHGACNGVMLPHVMQYNLPLCMEEMANIAHLLGEEVEGLSLREAAERGVEAVRNLMRDIRFPQTLTDLGVKEKDLKWIAESTAAITRLMRGNPRRVGVEDLEAILRSAL
ncbi:MAG: hydroxyacid-oxoacid transhydrogenase [candidate division NC10 bacterium]|nr:hydroxyacid-oxoacid transhydrogenase [candidate division NC10 bacterium]